MSRFLLEFVFTLLALGGIFMLVYGIRLKPQTVRGEGEAGEEMLIDLPRGSDESSVPMDPERTIQRNEKTAFDPDKHPPEKIESRNRS